MSERLLFWILFLPPFVALGYLILLTPWAPCLGFC
jgi:hypothetical protein